MLLAGFIEITAARWSGQKQFTTMKDRKCTFTFSEEVEGNRQKKENVPGIVRSEIISKTTEKGTYPMLIVEEEATGKLREVFANGVTMVK